MYRQGILGIYCLATVAEITLSSYPLAFPSAVLTPGVRQSGRSLEEGTARHLYIREHPREHLMLLDDDPSSTAIAALGDIGIRMRSRTMAVGTDGLPRYLKLLP